MLGYNRLDLDLAGLGFADQRLAAIGEHDRLRRELGALFRVQAIDDNQVTLLDSVLPATHFNNRVGQGKWTLRREADLFGSAQFLRAAL